MTCALENILAMYMFPEAYEVAIDGIRTLMVDRPPAYAPFFQEYYCIVHDCTFKQWSAVLAHIDTEDPKD